MIAAARGRLGSAARRARRSVSAAPRRLVAWSRRADAWANRRLERAWPRVERLLRRGRALARLWGRLLGRVLRPAGALLGGLVLRAAGRLERVLLRVRDLAVAGSVRASRTLTPERGICLTIIGAAACLAASQFVHYHGVELGQPGYAGLPAATPPTVDVQPAGEAHLYLLLPVAAVAAALALLVMRNGRRRGLGRVIFALGLGSAALVLLVDLPAARDVGVEASRFSGAKAVIDAGLYAELASAAGLMLGGALLVAAP